MKLFKDQLNLVVDTEIDELIAVAVEERKYSFAY